MHMLSSPTAMVTHNACEQLRLQVFLRSEIEQSFCAKHSSADSGRRLFFHFSEAAFPRAQLVEGAEVAFGTAVDESSGREAAVALQLLAPGAVTAAADVEQPGASPWLPNRFHHKGAHFPPQRRVHWSSRAQSMSAW